MAVILLAKRPTLCVIFISCSLYEHLCPARFPKAIAVLSTLFEGFQNIRYKHSVRTLIEPDQNLDECQENKNRSCYYENKNQQLPKDQNTYAF